MHIFYEIITQLQVKKTSMDMTFLVFVNRLNRLMTLTPFINRLSNQCRECTHLLRVSFVYHTDIIVYQLCAMAIISFRQKQFDSILFLMYYNLIMKYNSLYEQYFL